MLAKFISQGTCENDCVEESRRAMKSMCLNNTTSCSSVGRIKL